MAAEIKQTALNFMDHLPILQVVFPMLIAPLIVILNNSAF